MSTMTIEEKFEVAAEPDRVFRFLIDPERVVACMPGAELESVESERRFLGNVRVRVGAVEVAYRGAVELVSVDAAGRRVRAVGEGREKAGAGKVRLELELQVAAAPESGSEVLVRAEAALAGKIVRFGRGMIEAVSRQLFGDFARAVRERLEAGGAEAAASGPAAGARPIRAVPLFLRALWQWLRGLFGRS